jgi:ribonuclease Z
MTILHFLGTGSAMVTDRYNTCFLVRQKNNTLLVDCGGGHEILRQFKENNITIQDIDAIFISHSHADHILGFPFLFRDMITQQKKMKILCSDKVRQDILALVQMDIPEYIEKNKHLADFQNIDDICTYQGFCFFKINAEQHGFLFEEKDKRIIFSGDVPLCEVKIKDCHVLICEAFCSEKDNITRTGHHSPIEEVLACVKKNGIEKVIITHTATQLKKFSSETVMVPFEGEKLTL